MCTRARNTLCYRSRNHSREMLRFRIAPLSRRRKMSCGDSGRRNERTIYPSIFHRCRSICFYFHARTASSHDAAHNAALLLLRINSRDPIDSYSRRVRNGGGERGRRNVRARREFTRRRFNSRLAFSVSPRSEYPRVFDLIIDTARIIALRTFPRYRRVTPRIQYLCYVMKTITYGGGLFRSSQNYLRNGSWRTSHKQFIFTVSFSLARVRRTITRRGNFPKVSFKIPEVVRKYIPRIRVCMYAYKSQRCASPLSLSLSFSLFRRGTYM